MPPRPPKRPLTRSNDDSDEDEGRITHRGPRAFRAAPLRPDTPDAPQRRNVSFNQTHLGPTGTPKGPIRQASPTRPAITKSPPTMTPPNVNRPFTRREDLTAKELKHLLGLVEDVAGVEENQTDELVCEAVSNLVEHIKIFAEWTWATGPKFKRRDEEFLDLLLRPENEKLVRYITCLSMAGKGGRDAWMDLFYDVSCRQALVVGIIGRALKEHVFADLWFGATPDQRTKLEETEWKAGALVQDGFDRTRERADLIKSFDRIQDNFDFAVEKIMQQISALIAPLLDPGQDNPDNLPMTAEQEETLHLIVEEAARLSRVMHRQDNVVYFWPPTFKDEEWEPERMDAYNLREMMERSPYESPTKRNGNAPIYPVLKKGQEHRAEAIVRVVCFPGLVAYRMHGGRLGERQLAQERQRPDHRPPDVVARARATRIGEEVTSTAAGFRSRTLYKSVVLLWWSKQRLLTKEAGTSAHIDAINKGQMEKYEEDSQDVVELIQLWKEANPGMRSGA